MLNKPSSERECPECGGDTVRADNPEELVCTECGLVLEEGENNRENIDTGSSDEEWTAFASTEESQDIDDSQTTMPETVAEWKKWYPCPACGSVSFKQTETVTVYGSEDGNYGGDDADFVERIVCAECEVVLESE